MKNKFLSKESCTALWQNGLQILKKCQGRFQKQDQQKEEKDPLLQSYFSSLLSLVLCVAMFLGTSYAWFTSEVNNVGNEIYIGTLDVDLKMQVSGGEEPEFASLAEVDAQTGNNVTKLYTDAIRWEPGYTALRTLQVVEGEENDLAFAYTLTFTDGMATGRADEQMLKAAEWFDVWVFDHQNDPNKTYEKPASYADVIDTESGWKQVGTLAEVLSGKAVFRGKVDQVAVAADKETVHTYTIALHMNGEEIEVENEEAFKAKQEELNAVMGQKIGLNVKLVATQMNSEHVNFDDSDNIVYEAVSTLEELEEAFAEGGYYQLTDDIEFEKLVNIEPGAEVCLNMNGKKITIDPETSSNTMIWVKEGAKLTIDGNGTFDLENKNVALFYPEGELVIENGNFIRNPGEYTRGLFTGVKKTSSSVTIYGGYFDSGYYDEKGDPEKFMETHEAGQGKPGDANEYRNAIKENVSREFNHSGYGKFEIYGGTFANANPAWGDEGCMLPITPDYLRPWSYYQGGFIPGQIAYDDRIELPEGYTITQGKTEDGRPTYTVTYTAPATENSESGN